MKIKNVHQTVSPEATLSKSSTSCQIHIIPLSACCHVFAVYPSSWFQPSVPLLALPWDPRGSHTEAGLGERILGLPSAPSRSDVALMQQGAPQGSFHRDRDFQVELCNGTSSLRSCRCLFAAFMATSSRRRLTAAAFVWKCPTSLLELVCYFPNYIMLFHVYGCSLFFFFF